MDQETRTAIVNWYKYRTVCDNDLFGHYFRRIADLLTPRYNHLQELEATEWDPMIADYMERQHKHKDNSNDSGSTGGTTTDKSTNGGTSTTNGTINGKSKETTEGTADRTAGGSTTRKGTDVTDETGSGSENNQRLQGQLPDSSTYGSGFPEALNWTYTGGQEESKGSNTSTSKRTATTDGTDTTEESGHETTTGKRGTESGQENKSTTTTTATGETTRTNSGTSSMTRTAEGEEAERYAGRHEAPQDLLNRAYDFVVRSSALQWLIPQFNTVFFGVVDY